MRVRRPLLYRRTGPKVEDPLGVKFSFTFKVFRESSGFAMNFFSKLLASWFKFFVETWMKSAVFERAAAAPGSAGAVPAAAIGSH